MTLSVEQGPLNEMSQLSLRKLPLCISLGNTLQRFMRAYSESSSRSVGSRNAVVRFTGIYSQHLGTGFAIASTTRAGQALTHTSRPYTPRVTCRGEFTVPPMPKNGLHISITTLQGLQFMTHGFQCFLFLLGQRIRLKLYLVR